MIVSVRGFRVEDNEFEYAQASTVPLFKSFELPLRNVRVTVPEVVGVHVNVDDVPAVTVKPGGVVGGFDVDPDCAATAASRHATIESGKMRILKNALCIQETRLERRRNGEEYIYVQEPIEREWQGRRRGSNIYYGRRYKKGQMYEMQW